MIPTHYKILAVLFVVGAMLTGAFFFGVDYQKGRQAKKEVKVIEEKIEDHNEDDKAIAETARTVEKKKIIYRDKIIYLPATVVDADCPNDPSAGLRRSVVESLDRSLFESTDELSDPAD